jgi:hypothetical protein
VIELWTVTRTARLFEDVDYKQWGLKVLTPSESAARTASEHVLRPNDYRSDDVVLGEFLGDLELLVIAGSDSGNEVLVALPLDPRADWYRAAPSLEQFLRRYRVAEGDKFWVRTAA